MSSLGEVYYGDIVVVYKLSNVYSLTALLSRFDFMLYVVKQRLELVRRVLERNVLGKRKIAWDGRVTMSLSLVAYVLSGREVNYTKIYNVQFKCFC